MVEAIFPPLQNANRAEVIGLGSQATLIRFRQLHLQVQVRTNPVEVHCVDAMSEIDLTVTLDHSARGRISRFVVRRKINHVGTELLSLLVIQVTVQVGDLVERQAELGLKQSAKKHLLFVDFGSADNLIVGALCNFTADKLIVPRSEPS